jgi:hypothetical protein
METSCASCENAIQLGRQSYLRTWVRTDPALEPLLLKVRVQARLLSDRLCLDPDTHTNAVSVRFASQAALYLPFVEYSYSPFSYVNRAVLHKVTDRWCTVTEPNVTASDKVHKTPSAGGTKFLPPTAMLHVCDQACMPNAKLACHATRVCRAHSSRVNNVHQDQTLR